jgi:hypothetical protein
MFTLTRRRMAVGLVAGLVACGGFGVTPAQAQSVPIIVPPIAPIVVGITPGSPSLVVGSPGSSGAHSRAGMTWSRSGRADVDVEIDRHRGQVAAH